MVGGTRNRHVHCVGRLGGRYFGWEDPDGKVQLALVTCFILGIIGGYRARG